MAYGDVLVHTTGPSYGQNIVRNVGVSSGGGGGGAPDAHKVSHQDGGADELDLTGLSGGFQNPYPLVAGFLEDIEMRDEKTLWLDTAKTIGFVFDPTTGYLQVLGGSLSGQSGSSELNLTPNPIPANVNLKLKENGDDRYMELAGATLVLEASSTDRASQNIPAGDAPTIPIDGDQWESVTAEFHRKSGVTKEVMYV